MKIKKSTSFWITYVVLFVLYLITLFVSEAIAALVCPIIIGGFCFSGLGFQGVNVMDNLQRSKYYRAELDNRS
jgi:hypothetical protein